jgi:hypothetical protein
VWAEASETCGLRRKGGHLVGKGNKGKKPARIPRKLKKHVGKLLGDTSDGSRVTGLERGVGTFRTLPFIG